MKKILLAFGLLATGMSYSQTNQDSVNMILDNYFENTGGVDAWRNVKVIKMSGNFSYSGMDIPFENYLMADGRSATVISFQGMEMKQDVFDGTTHWATNFMTMSAEKSDAETTENAVRSAKDGIDQFLDYETKGYVITLVGTENIDGVECYKLKVNKGKQLADGEEVDDISYTYFDMENYIPIQTESELQSGEMKGKTMLSSFNDYEEVDGIMLPFSVTFKEKGGDGQTMEFDDIVINPTVDDKIFAFPGE